jgi:hypothetical protein
LSELETGINELRNVVQELLDTTRQLPTTQAIMSAIASDKASLDEDQLEELTLKVDQGLGYLKNLNTRVNEIDQGLHAKANSLVPSKPSIDEPHPFFKELSQTDHSREGVLRVSSGRFELIDERHAFDDTTKTESASFGPFYFIAAEDSPPGWLTVWYLHLRRRAGPSLSRLSATELKKWILDQPREAMEALTPEELFRAKTRHWQIRDRRKYSDLSATAYEKLTSQEELLARQVFEKQSIVNEEPERGPFHKEVLRYLKMPKVYIAIGTFTVTLLFVIFVKGFLLSPSANKTPEVENQTSPAASVSIDYGADGRTLYLSGAGAAREPIGYVQVGREREFSNRFGSQKFTSSEQALNEMKPVMGTLVVTHRDQLLAASGQGFRAVQESDLPQQRGCELFLGRINDQTPRGVHTDIGELELFNPGLRCRNLRPGDELIVDVAKP